MAPSLPARWRPGQRRKNTAIYWALRATAACLRRLPHGVRDLLGRGLGQLAYAVALPQRRLALRQLAVAMPELSAAQRRRTVRGMFVHLARSAFELLDLSGAVARAPLDAACAEALRAALAQGRGVVVISAHLGNWELLAQATAKAGLPLNVVAKPTYDPRLTAWLDAERRRFGLRVLWRRGRAGAAACLAVLRRREILALLIDQDTDVAGVHAPFFGRQAHTPSAAAALALKLDAPVLLLYAVRTPGGHRFVAEPIDVAAATAGVAPERAIWALTCAFNRAIEAAVRRLPEQWVWLHRRWRRATPLGTTPTAAGAVPAPARAAAAVTALAWALCAFAPRLAAGAPAPRPGAPEAPARPNGPVDFRCDALVVEEGGRRARGMGEVLVRQGDALLCCATLEAEAGADGAWRQVRCTGAVRLARGEEVVWAERAEWDLRARVLQLTGAPQVRRGQSTLRGSRVTVALGDGVVTVAHATGYVPAAPPAKAAQAAQAAQAPFAWQTGALPARCPIAEAPDAREAREP